MKVHYNNTPIVSLLLSLVFLLQGCHVYHKVPVSLDEAVAADKRMKVTTTDDKKYKFRKIEKTDSIYYGLVKTRGQRVKIPLQTDKIKSVHPVNKEGSTFLSVGVVVVPIGIFMILVLTADYGVELY